MANAEEDYTPVYDYVDDNFTNSKGFCAKDTVVRVGSIVVPLFFSIVILLSLVGNILVLVILGLYETLRSLTNIFIFNLAVSDLMFTLGLPFWSSYYMWGWTFGDPMCKGVSFIFSAGFYSSVVFLMLMTVQRFLAVVHPLSDWERGQWFAVMPIVAWVVSIAAALPALLFSEVMPDPEDTLFHCEFNSTTANFDVVYEQNIFFMAAFGIMGFCYIRILQTIFKCRTNKRHRTIRLIFCIVAVFFIGWAPYNIVIFLQTLVFYQIHPFNECYVSTKLDYALYFCRFLAYSHCCLNPVFYVFVGVKFRTHLKVILHKFIQRQCNTDPHRTRITSIQSQGSLY